MKVVIIEGACNKSEWLFWKFLSEQVFVNIQGRVYGAGGTQHFVNITRHLCNEMLQYYRDTGEKSQILACYDTTGITGYVDKVRRGLNNIKKTLDSTGVDLQIIERYCFEDCLLLFTEFSKWLLANGLQEQDKSLLEYYLYTLDNWRDSQELVNFVKTQKEYKRRFYEFKTRNNLPDEIATEIVLRNTSQEKLAGYLLEHLTQDTHFEVSKGHLSDCWCNSCLIQSTCDTHKEIQANGTDPKECGLYVSNKLTESQIANELISKSPMLADIANKYPWLYS